MGSRGKGLGTSAARPADARAVARSAALPALWAAAALAAAGCAGAPLAPEGFDDRIVEGAPFRHRVLTHAHPAAGVLHVYIEGDGRAWLNRTTISRDPTPLDPLMLGLMTLDRAPSVYVGRPCYFGLADSTGCDARYWTSHRYSEAVVESMAHAIETLAAEGRYEGIALFGHSGGGTLAALLASRLNVAALVTLAANLDVAHWADLHGYTPLDGSLDPVRDRTLPREIFQRHWFGSDDREVPLNLASTLEPQVGTDSLRIQPGFDHGCCWSEIWPQQLAELDAAWKREEKDSKSSRTDPGPLPILDAAGLHASPSASASGAAPESEAYDRGVALP